MKANGSVLRETEPAHTAIAYRRVEEDVVLEIRLVGDGLEVRRRLLAKISHLERQVAGDVGVSLSETQFENSRLQGVVVTGGIPGRWAQCRS